MSKENKKNTDFLKKLKNSWAVFIFLNTFCPFLFFLWCLGATLWIQSILASILIAGLHFFLFYKYLRVSFQGQDIKGWDRWKLKPVLDQYIPGVPATVIQNKTPFVLSFHFFFFKKIVFSSAFLSYFTKQEIEQTLKLQGYYFENHIIRQLSQLSYFLLIGFWPLHLLCFLCKILKISFLKYFFEVLMKYVLYVHLLPLTHHFYYRLDQKLFQIFQTDYKELLLRNQAFLEVSCFSPSVIWTPLLTAYGDSYFNIQPSLVKRIQKLEASSS